MLENDLADLAEAKKQKAAKTADKPTRPVPQG
jgi:hypothetical protein